MIACAVVRRRTSLTTSARFRPRPLSVSDSGGVLLGLALDRGQAWPTSCHPGRVIDTDKPKPTWVDALEQSLLLAIILFSLITWMLLLAVFVH
jgi:hypothetical protein